MLHMLREFPEAIPSEPCLAANALGAAGGLAAAAHASCSGASGEQHVASSAAAGAVTALVFGREESGLTEGELRAVSHACAIPTGSMQGSLNLSHAVAVVLGEVGTWAGHRQQAWQDLGAMCMLACMMQTVAWQNA